jgi:hydrogenase maturation factor HypE
MDAEVIHISIDELKKFATTGDEEIKKELTEILKMCKIPEEKAEQLRQAIREYVKHIIKTKGLPEEEWLTEALYRIFIHAIYITNTALQQCIFKTNLDALLNT